MLAPSFLFEVHMLVRLLFLFCALSLLAGDRAPAPVVKHPFKIPGPLVPLIQEDGHSCGFLALSAIYNSYGLDPDKMNLKPRLGTDIPLIPFMPDTTGTVQPDFFRVLKQDGFRTVAVDLETAGAKQSVIVHLEMDQYALALIKRRENGNLHWIVLTAHEQGRLTVGDSLKRGLYREPLDDFLANHIQSILLLSPGEPNPNASYAAEHGRGIFDMISPWRDGLLSVFLGGIAFMAFRWKNAAYKKQKAKL